MARSTFLPGAIVMACVTALLIDIAFLPRGTVVGGMMKSRRGGTNCIFLEHRALLIPTPGGFAAREWDLSREYRPRDGEYDVRVSRPRRYERGTWAATEREWRWFMEIADSRGLSPSLSPQEAAAANAAIAGFLQGRGFAREDVLAVYNGGTNRTEALPGGYVHNAISALVACVGVWSFLTYSSRAGAEARGEWFAEQGRCAGCGYSRAGLAGRACPECGMSQK